jgi:hypothetical protein
MLPRLFALQSSILNALTQYGMPSEISNIIAGYIDVHPLITEILFQLRLFDPLLSTMLLNELRVDRLDEQRVSALFQVYDLGLMKRFTYYTIRTYYGFQSILDQYNSVIECVAYLAHELNAPMLIPIFLDDSSGFMVNIELHDMLFQIFQYDLVDYLDLSFAMNGNIRRSFHEVLDNYHKNFHNLVYANLGPIFGNQPNAVNWWNFNPLFHSQIMCIINNDLEHLISPGLIQGGRTHAEFARIIDNHGLVM